VKEGDFVWMGVSHIVTLQALAIFGILLIFIAKHYLDQKWRDRVGIILGVLMLVQELSDLSIRLFYLHQPLTDNLPLHLCGPIYYMVAIMLMTRNKTLYELTYFLGLAGASNSLLTPGEIFPFPHILNITFFTTHGMIVIGVLYMTIVLGYRPTWKAFGKTMIFLNVFALLVIPVNYFLNTNYLCYPPPGGTLMDLLGPWPLYLVFVEMLGVVLFLLAFSPFLISDVIKWRKKKEKDR